MSGSILVPPANPFFDLQALIKQAIEQQDDDQGPQSPLDSEGYSSLSSLPTSPDIGPSSDLPPLPRLSFLNSDVTDSVAKDDKQPEKPRKSGKQIPHHRQARKNKAANASRQKRQAKERSDGYVQARPEARHKHLGRAQGIVTKIDIKTLPVARTGYIAIEKRPKRKGRRFAGVTNRPTPSLEKLVSKHGFTLQQWDGSEPVGLVDQNNRVIGVLAGHPNDTSWPSLQAQAAQALEGLSSRVVIPKEKRNHRRGKFVALTCGVSHGGGQQAPSNLYNEPEIEEILTELNSLGPFKRIARFSSSVMATWAPDLYDYYQSNIKLIHDRYPHLKQIFPGCIFSAAMYNGGPQTVCQKHKDKGNLVFGQCAVTNFGDFDYKKGGHLVLWDLKLVVEFPPGCTILLPSAIVAHSNVAIAPHERRYSFAQYTAGGLFRWVDQGFQTKEEQMESLTDAERQAENARLERMWEFGLSLLPTANTN